MDDSNNKNSPQPAPVMPGQAPVQPAPQQPGQPATPQPGYPTPPKKGLSKGALWGIIGGSVGLVLVIVIVLLIVFLSGPSKKDYRDAVDLINSTNSTFSSSSLTSGDPSDNDFEDKLNETIGKVDSAHKKIGETKAMRDSEVKNAYDNYIKEWEKLKPTLKEAGTLAKQQRAFSKACSLSSVRISYTSKTGDEVAKQFDDVMQDCFKVVDDLKKSKNDKVVKFAEDIKKYYDELKKYYVSFADRISKKDYTSPLPKYPTRPSSTYSLASALNITDSLKSVSDAYKDFKNILEKKANA